MDKPVQHRVFRARVKQTGRQADVAQGPRQPEFRDQIADDIGGIVPGRASASLTQACRSALTRRLKHSTCGSITQEV